MLVNRPTEYIPIPDARPIAEVHQRAAAVVSPRTLPLCWRIVPAPRKPMPVITP